MAKGIEMNGMLRGKRGGVVYSRVNGEQLSRARATQVANPKTTAQMAQRMIFATATHAYSIMKPIVDHSYEGVKYGSKTQQKFMQDALALLRSRAANDDGNFLIPNVVALAANPYIVSRGTLTSPVHIGFNSDEDEVQITAMSNPQVDGNYVVTAKSFCDALGINKGDQITLVAIVKDEAQPVIGSYDGREYRRNKFIYSRITVKADAADSELVYSEEEKKWGSAVVVEGFGSNGFNVNEATTSTFEFGYSVDGMLAFGCIRSVKEGEKWLRSTTQLEWINTQLIYNFNDMLPAWTSGGTKIAFESDKYLNNAEQEVVVTTPGLTSVAARMDEGGSIIVLPAAALSKGAYEDSPIVDNSTNKQPYKLLSNGHVALQVGKVILDGYITKEFAEKQLGTTIVVDQ